MKFFHGYLLSLILLLILSSLIFWLLDPIFTSRISVLSPLPDFLSIPKNKQVSTLSLFLPKIDITNSPSIKKPSIQAKSAFIFDLSTNKTLFAKNINQRFPMASLTKVMTAIIALENKKADDKYFVRKEDLVGENSMNLSEGESMSLEELLYGLILVSGNDSAEVLADNYSKGRSEFIKSMNEKAKSLGLKNTNFTNPTGLQGNGEQYSTAYDLFVMTDYALSNFPLFNRVSSTYTYNIERSDAHKAFYLVNETNLLTSYPGVKGVKTGYTPEAGLCLITYLDYKGHKIIGVILGSNNRRQEMKDLLDYSLKAQGVEPPEHQ